MTDFANNEETANEAQSENKLVSPKYQYPSYLQRLWIRFYVALKALNIIIKQIPK